MAVRTRKLAECLGAEITGVDLAAATADDVAAILDAWYTHLVLVFPGQHLTPEQHIAFSERIGPLVVHPSGRHNHPAYPEILLLTNAVDADGKALGLRDGGSFWHSDLSYMASPSDGSLLYALEVPKIGGDTEWANMYAAYDMLPDALKSRIAGLRAVHQFDQAANPRLKKPEEVVAGEGDIGTMWAKKTADVKARTPNSVHPVVRTHPITGRKALFVSPRFTIAIEGMAPDAGEALLCELFAHAEERRFVYHHRWRKGDLVMWDNRCTSHLACGGFALPEIRRMHRTTLAGTAPVA